MQTPGVKGKIIKAILLTLAAAGVLTLAVTAPNAAILLKPLIKRMRGEGSGIDSDAIERAVARLKKQRLVRFFVKNGKMFLEITEKGKKRVREFEFDEMRLVFPVSKQWNGRWTMILFDIPEYQKGARDALRRKLKELGCYQYHRSVFVHPVSCGDEIDFLAEFFQISPHIIHFETPTLGSQEYRARRHFKLLV